MVNTETDLSIVTDIRNFLLSDTEHARMNIDDQGGRPDRWHEIIEQYTRQSLTFTRDIFPALQGISKRFHRHWKSQYMAGLWRKGIIGDLLWRYMCVPQPGHPIPVQWRAPSWLWASVAGPVTWSISGYLLTDLATYVSGSTTLAGFDAFGEVEFGSTTLRGRCILATLQYSYFGLVDTKFPGQRIDFVSYKDRYWTASYSVQQFAPDYDFYSPYFVRPRSKPLELGIDVKILAMAESRPSYERGIRTHFLVLRNLDEENQLYERIGYLVLYETESFTVADLLLAEEETRHLI